MMAAAMNIIRTWWYPIDGRYRRAPTINDGMLPIYPAVIRVLIESTVQAVSQKRSESSTTTPRYTDGPATLSHLRP